MDFCETLSMETQVANIGPKGGVTVACPLCTFKKHATLPKKLYNKSVRITCLCKNQYVTLFCSREHYRKEIDLIGHYWDAFDKEHIVVVKNISHTGILFNTGRKKPVVTPGEFIQMKFRLNFSTWINATVKVTRVEENYVGCSFHILSEHHQKQIGFFLR